MINAEEIKKIIDANPQVTGITFTCYPKTEDLFWRGFKSTLGGCAAVLLCVSMFMILGLVI